MSVAPSEKTGQTGRIKEVSISLAELAKNIDIDGDGEVEPDEKEILDTLRSMDVDGDGTISLKELVNLGAKLNEQRDQAKFYKKVAYGVMVVAILAIAAVFLACFAAVEASKDTRPGDDGVMKTVTVGSDPKVVATAGYQETIALTALHSASFATLRGIKDVGFKVGKRLYQYTITGFEQDINTDGSSNVRLFTSRGDSIYVSKTAANLERSQTGQTIDITAAALQNRKLLSELSEDHRRSLLQTNMGDDGSLGGGSVTTNNQQVPYDAAAMATLATQGDFNMTDDQLPDAAKSGSCGLPYMGRDPVTQSCVCNNGFKGEATYSNELGKWVQDEPCEFVPPPEGTVWECNLDPELLDPEGGKCSVNCAVTGEKVKLVVMGKTAVWQVSGKTKEGCDLPDLPRNVEDFSMRTIQTNTTQYFFELKIEYQFKCAVGYSSNSPTGPIYDAEMKNWTLNCNEAWIPDPHAMAVSNSSSNETENADHTECEDGFHSESPYMWFPGFPWDPFARWMPFMELRGKMEEFNQWKSHYPSTMNETDVDVPPLPINPETNMPHHISSECKRDKDGYSYDCDDGFCSVEEVQPPNKKVRLHHQRVFDGEMEIYAHCADGYIGNVSWVNGTWKEHCDDVLPYCPMDSVRDSGTGCFCHPRSHKGPGYELERFYEPEMTGTPPVFAVGKFVKKQDKGISGCKKKKCPAKSKDIFPDDPNFLECVCKVPGTGVVEFNETTMTWNAEECAAEPVGTDQRLMEDNCPHVHEHTGDDSTGNYARVPGSAFYNKQTGNCECPANANGVIWDQKPAMRACDLDADCTSTWLWIDGKLEYFASPSYVTAETTAKAEKYEWYGSCTTW